MIFILSHVEPETRIAAFPLCLLCILWPIAFAAGWACQWLSFKGNQVRVFCAMQLMVYKVSAKELNRMPGQVTALNSLPS